MLLNPGPTNTRERTKYAQHRGSDVCHRTEDFKSVLEETKELLLDRFEDKSFNVALLGGSGTVGMEAMISSLVEDDIVVINAGVYGQRAIDMLKVYNVNHTEIDANQLERNENYKCVYFVENETTTGEHFPIDRMAKLYPNAKFFIDATSSFGASDYSDFHDSILGLSFCSNKCLQSTPGLGIVIWNKNLQYKARSYYCNLERYLSDDLPFTLPVQSVFALNTTLEITENQCNVFNDRRDGLIDELSGMGIECINNLPSNSIIGFKHPTMTYEELRDYLYERDVVIYAGIKGVDRSFRVSTMSALFDKNFTEVIRLFNDSCIL
jgi:2-aminoethylphosphonate-pyruvate transaminase